MLWCVTCALLPLVLVAPKILGPVNGVAWRNPPVSESLRPPGQVRSLPAGYPAEPFLNPELRLRYAFLVASSLARSLRVSSLSLEPSSASASHSSGALQAVAWHTYQLDYLRLRAAYAYTSSLLSCVRVLSMLAGALGLANWSRDLNIYANTWGEATFSHHSDATSARHGHPSMSDMEHFVAKQAARTPEAKFIKWMQNMRKDPEGWMRMSPAETAALWHPSFHYLEQLFCFILVIWMLDTRYTRLTDTSHSYVSHDSLICDTTHWFMT